MLVEFIGSMGAGKSRLREMVLSLKARELRSAYRIRRGEDVSNERAWEILSLGSFRRRLKFALCKRIMGPMLFRFRPALSLLLERGLPDNLCPLYRYVADGTTSGFDLSVSQSRNLLFQECLAHASVLALGRAEDVCLFDEYLLQRALSFCVSDPLFVSKLEGYVDLAPGRHLVVSLAVNEAVARDRVGKRKRRRVHSPLEVALAIQAHYELESILKRKRVRMISLSGEASLEENARRVAEEVSRLKGVVPHSTNSCLS